jgi:hypothetical protein
MSAKFACNLIATLSQPPWTEELDWSLHTNFDWEKRVPFYAYVQPNCAAPRATEQGSLFPKFGALPTELQLRILALCPANTLFQVMHALPSLRTEASKLFWTMPNASFLIQASWLLDGGYPGFTYIELSFLQYVKRVEIEYSGEAEATICSYDEQGSTPRQELILRFWTSLIQRLPDAEEVVIVQNWTSPNSMEDQELVAHPLRMLIQACPPRIDVAAIVMEFDDSPVNTYTPLLPAKWWQRWLYQPAASGSWVKSHERWGNTTVLPPTKRFIGPVGEFQGLLYQRERHSYQKWGLWPLMIEALDRHHFDKGRNRPFTCPVPGCNTYIARVGEWSIHAAELHSQESRRGDPIALLPDELRVVFKERLGTLTEMGSELDRQHVRLFKDWTTQSKEKRREIQRKWMDQLKNDPNWNTGKKAGESRLWTRFWKQMYPTDKYCYGEVSG